MKLQRNALSVIEAPTGNEDDNDLEFDHVQWNSSPDFGELTFLSETISSSHCLLLVTI